MSTRKFPSQFTQKVTPVSADKLMIADSADSNIIKYITFADVQWPQWVGITWRWAYNWATAYSVNDAVSYTNGNSYVCILASTGNVPTNATYWGALVQPVDASTSVKWVAEEATLSEQGSQTATGGTWARLYINPVNTAKTSSGSSDENKIPLLNASGKLATWFIDATAFNEEIFGNSSDWVQGDSNLTITGSNNTFITKNFSSWTAGSTARTCTVTPTNCIVWIKIAGNADFTNWTFNFSWVGWPWWAWATGTSGAWTNWTVWNSTNYTITAAWLGGAAWGASSAWGALWAKLSSSLNTNLFYIDAFCWGWWWGWWSTPSAPANWGTGWNGWNWWWWLIITVWGTVVFSSTVVTVAWADWSAWANGTSWGSWWGGWGGWGGGTFVLLYRWTLTGSLTPTVSWGNSWAGGTWSWTTAAAGWGGAGSLFNSWTVWGSTSSSSTWGAGGTWGAGTFLIKKI